MKDKILAEIKKELKRGMCDNSTQLTQALGARLRISDHQVRGVLEMNFGKAQDVKHILECAKWLNKITK